MSQQQQPIMPPTQPSHVPPKKRKTIDLPIPVFVLMIVGILIALMVGMFWAGFSYEGELAADKSEISRLTRELDAAKAQAAPSDSSDQNQPEDNSTTVPDGIEIISIEDKGSEYGYRNVSITVKNNLNTQLSNVFINFSIEDQAGNSVDRRGRRRNCCPARRQCWMPRSRMTVRSPARRLFPRSGLQWTETILPETATINGMWSQAL